MSYAVIVTLIACSELIGIIIIVKINRSTNKAISDLNQTLIDCHTTINSLQNQLEVAATMISPEEAYNGFRKYTNKES